MRERPIVLARLKPQTNEMYETKGRPKSLTRLHQVCSTSSLDRRKISSVFSVTLGSSAV